MSYMGASYDDINSNMKKLLPETADNNFADYPLTGGKWLTGKDKAPGGGYCYIRTENEMPKGKGHSGYVWGTGNFGFGYYHLRTREAQKTLYQRITDQRVYTGASASGVGCGCFGSKAPEPDAIPTELPVKLPAEELDILRLLFHARSVCTMANDAQAKLDQEAEAHAVAQGHHQMNQGIQLGTMMATGPGF
jgi:hypothetical protein